MYFHIMQLLCEVGTIMMSALYVRKSTESLSYSKSHRKWQCWDSNPGSVTSDSLLLTPMPHCMVNAN